MAVISPNSVDSGANYITVVEVDPYLPQQKCIQKSTLRQYMTLGGMLRGTVHHPQKFEMCKTSRGISTVVELLFVWVSASHMSVIATNGVIS